MAFPTKVRDGTRVTKNGGTGTLASSVTCTVGQIIVCHIFGNSSGTGTIGTPVGWTLRYSRALSGSGTYKPCVAIFEKVAASTTETCTITVAGTDFYGYSQCSCLSSDATFDATSSTSTDNGNSTATTATVTAAAALGADSLVFAGLTAEQGGGGTNLFSTPASFNGSTTGVTSIGTNPNDGTTIAYDLSIKSVSAGVTPAAAWTWGTASHYSGYLVAYYSSGGGSTFNDSVAESVTAAVAQDTTASFVSARAESLTATDASTVLMTAPVAASDTLTAADSITAQVVSPVVESLSATDAQSVLVSAVGAASDTLTAADAETVLMTAVGARAETLTAAETEGGTITTAAARAESLTASDAQDATVTSAGVNAVAETLTAADAASATVVFAAATVAETLAATATQGATMIVVGVRAESLAALDSIVASMIAVGVRAEVLTAADGQAAHAIFVGTLADILSAVATTDATGGSGEPPLYLPTRLRVLDPTSTLVVESIAAQLDVADVHARMTTAVPTSALEPVSVATTSDLFHG